MAYRPDTIFQVFSDFLKHNPAATAELQKLFDRAGHALYCSSHLCDYLVPPQSIILYNYQELQDIKPKIINERRAVSSSYRRQILWLSLHGIPSRSIAFVLRYELEKKPHNFIPYEEYLETVESFIRLSIAERAHNWRCTPNSDAKSRAYYINMVKDKHQGKDITYWGFKPWKLYEAMQHALLDNGEKIYLDRQKIGTNQEEEATNEVDEDKLLLWRSITGSVPRSSHVPKEIRALMDKHAQADRRKRWVEQELGYVQSNLKMELALINRMMDQIIQTGKIEQTLKRPIPSLEAMDIVLKHDSDRYDPASTTAFDNESELDDELEFDESSDLADDSSPNDDESSLDNESAFDDDYRVDDEPPCDDDSLFDDESSLDNEGAFVDEPVFDDESDLDDEYPFDDEPNLDEAIR